MKDVKIGIQLYSLMAEFEADPEKTLADIKAMGYTGVEFPTFMLFRSAKEEFSTKPASYFKEMLAKAELDCYGLLVSWKDVQPDTLDFTIEYCKELGAPFLIIGSVPRDLVPDIESANKAIDYMFEIQKKINAAGLPTGYHNHDSDFFNVIEGKTFFEHIFDRAPEDFIMLLDTGNAHAGGANSFDLLNKYRHRSPYFHAKGYSQKEGYLAWIGKDDYNWVSLIDLAVKVGGAEIFDVEFGSRGDWSAYDKAKFSRDVIFDALSKM